MKQFFAFVWKEFHHILRDRRTMLILIGMPIVQIILFGFAISTEVKDIKTAVVAPNLNADAHYLIDRLDAGEYFSVKYVTGSVKEVERLFRQNQIELAVVLPDDLQRGRFDSESVQLIVDATDPNLALTRTAYAQNVLSAIRQSLTANLSAEAGEPHLKVTTKLLYNPQMKSAYNFVPGVMGLILMLICAMMTSISIVREKETGTMEVLLVSPAGALFIILSKSVPYLVLSLVNLTTILLLAVLVLDVPIAGSLAALIGVSLLFIFVSLALGLLISCVVRTQVAALLASALLLLLPTVLLSGLIFPVESMPPVLQAVACAIPARWYIGAVRRLMIEGVPPAYVATEVAVLTVMALALVALTARLFKKRLD